MLQKEIPESPGTNKMLTTSSHQINANEIERDVIIQLGIWVKLKNNTKGQ